MVSADIALVSQVVGEGDVYVIRPSPARCRRAILRPLRDSHRTRQESAIAVRIVRQHINCHSQHRGDRRSIVARARRSAGDGPELDSGCSSLTSKHRPPAGDARPFAHQAPWSRHGRLAGIWNPANRTGSKHRGFLYVSRRRYPSSSISRRNPMLVLSSTLRRGRCVLSFSSMPTGKPKSDLPGRSPKSVSRSVVVCALIGETSACANKSRTDQPHGPSMS